jgi:hypothetical protein
MGSLHELRKLERSRAGDWQSTVSNGSNFESGERETWNMSITDWGEIFGSTKQECGDQEGVHRDHRRWQGKAEGHLRKEP